ncbi:DNA polymerase III subunit delta [Cyclobacteriaceae bacterium]|nr:DNA polymerase III subunit delta [Cyclobacteriaceae bacterium]
MPISATDVLKDLKKENYAPVYFLQGDEPFFIDQISDFIEKNALDESQKGFNQMVMYGRDHDVASVLTQAKRFPMMSDRQVVIVKEAQNISDLNNENGSKQLLAYLENPLASTILVFAYKNKTLDGRKALGKKIDKKAVLVNSKKLYDNQVPDWVRSYCIDHGHAIGTKALMLIAESVGNDLSKISNEVQKMLINLKDHTEINEEHVQKYIGISKDYNVFELQKAIGDKDILKANKIINYFEQDPKGNPLIPIVALLYGYFAKVLLVHHSPEKNDKAIATKLKVNPFFAKDYIRAARNYNLTSVVAALQAIHKADKQSKGIVVGGSEGQILKELIFVIMHS